jgi:stress response protein SCP2
MMRRTKENSWVFVELDIPAEIGSHFLDILEPNIGDVIRHEIPNAPRRQHVSFQMSKGSVVHFQGSHFLKRLSVSLDADVDDDATEAVDMDITAVFYSDDGHLLGAVDSVNEEMFGVSHSGEMHYEHHEHIQESLSIDLAQLPDRVKHIFLVLTIQHGSFQGIQNVHMHIADQDAQDIATMNVPAGHKESALVVARIYDTNSRLTKRWAIHSLGKFFSHGGTSWHTDECKKELLQARLALQLAPLTLQAS